MTLGNLSVTSKSGKQKTSDSVILVVNEFLPTFLPRRIEITQGFAWVIMRVGTWERGLCSHKVEKPQRDDQVWPDCPFTTHSVTGGGRTDEATLLYILLGTLI